MNSFQTAIDAHLSLLKDHGYTEDALNAFPYPKNLQDRMTEHFAVAVLHGLMDDKQRSFSVPLTGFFREDKDTVLLEPGFTYNPRTGGFIMDRMTGTLASAKIDLPLRNPLIDLPPADDLYFKLCQRSIETSRHQQPLDAGQVQFIDVAANFNRALLEQTGYLRRLQKPLKQDWFMMAFEEKLAQQLRSPNAIAKPTFVLPFSKHLDGDSYRTQLRLLYQFDRKKPALTGLKAIHAQAPSANMRYIIPPDQTMPSPARVQDDLAIDGMKKIAAVMHGTIRGPRHHR